jgi:hypothetical protein
MAVALARRGVREKRVAADPFNRYIRTGHDSAHGQAMRAEIAAIVEEIKQSVGLLRRHL